MKRYLFYINSSRGLERVFYQPYGWEQAGYELERNITYQGVFRKYVVSSLDFIKDGKAILKALKESEGTECDADFIVKRFDPSTHYYTQCFSGKIDFGTHLRSKTKIRVNIIDTSFAQSVKNREDIPVSLTKLIDQDGGAIIPFTNEGIDVILPQRRDYYKDTFHAFLGETYTGNHSLPLELITAQTTNSHTVVDTSSYTGVDGSVYLGTDSHSLNISGYIVVLVNFQGTLDIELRVYSGSGLERYVNVLNYTASSLENYWVNITINENITCNSGEWLNIVMILNKTAGSGITGDYVCNLIVATRGDLFSETTVKAFFYHEAFMRILQSITGTAEPLYSDYFGRTDSEPTPYGGDGNGSLGVVLSGKQLRGFDFTDIPAYCSLKELFTSLRAVLNIGMGIESDKVRIELLSYFYGVFIIQDATPTELTFSNCSNIEEGVYADMIYNKITVGFEKSENTESLGGLFEYNTKITYGNIIKSIKRELSLVSPYRADDTGVMLARSKPKSTFPEEDTSVDEDNFLLKVIRDGGDILAETDENYTSITGTVNDSSVCNVEYSPARNLYRHGANLRSFLEFYTSSYLIYTKQEKNSRLVSEKIGGSPITESADILVDDLALPYYEASKYTFETPITQTQISIIDEGTTGGVSNRYGIIKFRENSDDPIWKYGWILSMKVKDDGVKSVASFELLKVDPAVATSLEPS